ncbi:DUF3095 domain-containing protein [Dyadobacter psychrophilus]|uniref:DUF3095 domain-containing protein n=1 Tax=Dyadobacter psychrophilus TaxID=651661 RepID=A0A1T5BVI3_9BACT|nr:DUF3095 domain-containing protein [Dyadobacter psychrophilus]SKB51215.1 Protein of unknown function [Dyadobacter psychrophilus]
MAMSKDEQFYSRLPENHISLNDLLTEEHLFYKVPESWFVLITDIQNSTLAVVNGSHETVNLVATGSIVTVLNIAFKANIVVPFFFGGDGATFLLPAAIVDRVMPALRLYKANTWANFELKLRIGLVAVRDIYAQGHELKLSKFRRSHIFAIPIILGNGLNYAEQVIKGEGYLLSGPDSSEGDLDLSGMQCRWDRIEPPEQSNEIVTLLVIAVKVEEQPQVFSKVLHQIDAIYGSPEARQPISVPKLKWKTTFNRLEVKVKTGHANIFNIIGNWFAAITGYFYFRTAKGKNYLKSLVEMADTLVIDGKINTVISGTERQRIALQKVLDDMESNNEIRYGLYVSTESVMSCYVRDLKDGHIHFVDGSDGGYTKAAGVLKPKLRKF